MRWRLCWQLMKLLNDFKIKKSPSKLCIYIIFLMFCQCETQQEGEGGGSSASWSWFCSKKGVWGVWGWFSPLVSSLGQMFVLGLHWVKPRLEEILGKEPQGFVPPKSPNSNVLFTEFPFWIRGFGSKFRGVVSLGRCSQNSQPHQGVPFPPPPLESSLLG